jgi:hypothetical protein
MEDYRITKLRAYLFNILSTLTKTTKQINANMLANDIDNYSLDKIPTQSVVTKWISGIEIHRDVYSFRSRKAYSKEALNNLQNIGFFEQFENAIETNNKAGNLPDIKGIESIECLNPGTMLSNDNGNAATFDIQIQITYRKNNNEREVSL